MVTSVKNFRFIISIGSVAVILLLTLIHANGQSGEKTVIRGLYIGMPFDDANNISFDDLNKEIIEKDYVYGYRVIRFSKTIGAGIFSRRTCAEIIFNANNSVMAIDLRGCFFGATGFELSEFAQKFIDAYNISKMEGSIDYDNSSITKTYRGHSSFDETISIRQTTRMSGGLSSVGDIEVTIVPSPKGNFD